MNEELPAGVGSRCAVFPKMGVFSLFSAPKVVGRVTGIVTTLKREKEKRLQW